MPLPTTWRNFIDETHSTGFELTRHFFQRLLDIEIAGPGQVKKAIIGIVAILVSLAILPSQAYFMKYQALTRLGDAGLYRRAVMADHLFLILISVDLTALLTTLIWPSLFPALRDYLSLAGLPILPRQIFKAKLLSLFAFLCAFELSLNLLPGVMLAAITGGGYVGSGAAPLTGLLLSTTLAGFFVFFLLLLVQACLLSAISPARYARASIVVQAVLFMFQLAAAPFILSVPNWHTHMDYRGALLQWFPPFWFLGLDQWIAGNADPVARHFAIRSLLAVAGAALLSVAVYAWVYARHRRALLETPVMPRLGGSVFAAISNSIEHRTGRPQDAGIIAFVTATLARSAEHRMVLAIFAAVAVAVIMNGLISSVVAVGAQSWAMNRAGLAQVAASSPLALSFVLLTGVRYLFRLPTELRANWLFRMNAASARDSLIPAVDRFMTWWVAIPVAVLTAPIEVLMFGWVRGLAAVPLNLLASLVLKELLLRNITAMPFTTVYVTSEKPLIHLVMTYGLAAAAYIALFGWTVRSASREAPLYLIVSGLLVFGWAVLRKTRRDVQPAAAVSEDEDAEQAICALAIERD